MRASDLRTFRFILEEIVDLRNRAVEHGHLIAVVVHVQDQVLTHNGQSNQCDVTALFVHRRSQMNPLTLISSIFYRSLGGAANMRDKYVAADPDSDARRHSH